jgi:hypothetical protein
MTQKRFRATLEAEPDGGHFIRIPFDVPQVFGTPARVAVRGTLNGSTFRKQVRAAAKIEAGDDVRVIFERAE